MQPPDIREMAGWGLFDLGALICGINFYLSFIRFPLHQWSGRSRESFRYVSIIPFFGSIPLIIGLIMLGPKSGGFGYVGIGLAVFDTGGIHWMVGSIAWHALKERKKWQERRKRQERRRH